MLLIIISDRRNIACPAVLYSLKNSNIRGGKRTIATIGLDNIVVVDSDDALLIAAKGKIQDVKKVAEEIKKRQ